MRKITAGLFISLDGVVESPDKWSMSSFTPEIGQVIQSQMDAADAVLLGRRTYEEFAAYWPDKTSVDEPFADYINNTPKYVVSTTLHSVGWRNATLIDGNAAKKEIAALKRQRGKNIGMTGSGTLVHWLLREGLLDELNLLLYPIVVGNGRRLFEQTAGELHLKLAESRTLSNGVIAATYVPAGR